MSEPVNVPPLLRAFMFAQFANLFKFSLWWTSLSPLLYSMVGGNASIIGAGRIVYNTAVCVCSPIGALLVEKFRPTTILSVAAAVRFVIYVVLVPLVWLLFNTSIIHEMNEDAVYVSLLVFLFVDGLAVAGSVILDIDIAGLDIMGGNYSISITDAMRNFFNGAQEFFFSACFIVFAPAMAFVGMGAKKLFHKPLSEGSISELQAESGALVAIFMIGFFVASLLQWFFIARMKAKTVDDVESEGAGAAARTLDTSSLRENLIPDGSDAASANEAAAPAAPPTTIRSILSDLKMAAITTISNRPIFFRLIFLGFEIAFEDAAIVVIAAQMGLRCEWLGAGGSVSGNIWTAVAVAAGKVGGAVASVVMMKCYTPPKQPSGYFALFVFTTVSTLATVGFPLIEAAYHQGTLSADGARGIHLTLFLLYFFFSTLSKLGFMSLLQSMAASIENGARCFGFIAVIATTMDALVIMGLSVFFIDDTLATLEQPLWYVAYCYMAHGLLELILGPFLILRPMAVTAAAAAEAEDSVAASSAAPAPGATAEYTQRAVAMPVGNGSVAATTTTTLTAVLATSQPTAVSVMARRRSQLDTEPNAAIPVGTQGINDGGLLHTSMAGSYTRPGVLPRSPRTPRTSTLT